MDGMAVTIEYAHYRSGVVLCVDDKLSTNTPFRRAHSCESWRVCVRVPFNLNLLHKLAGDTDNNFNKINSFSPKIKEKPTHYTTTQQEVLEYGCLGGSEPPGRRQLDLVSDKTTTKRPTFAQIQDYAIKVGLTC